MKTAIDKAAHAALLAGLGKLDEAEDPLSRSDPGAGACPRVTENSKVPIYVNNLAGDIQNPGDLKATRRPFTVGRSRSKRRRSAAMHAIWPATLNNLALVLKRQGRYDEAVPLYERALRTLEGLVPEDHSISRSCRIGVSRRCLQVIREKAGRRGKRGDESDGPGSVYAGFPLAFQRAGGRDGAR